MQSIAADVDSTRKMVENSQRSERLLRRLEADGAQYIPGAGEVEYTGDTLGVMTKGGGLWVAIRQEKDVSADVKYRVCCFACTLPFGVRTLYLYPRIQLYSNPTREYLCFPNIY